MPRQGHIDSIGVLQHVIARGIEQREIFPQWGQATQWGLRYFLHHRTPEQFHNMIRDQYIKLHQGVWFATAGEIAGHYYGNYMGMKLKQQFREQVLTQIHFKRG
jgi:hypothetical protein